MISLSEVCRKSMITYSRKEDLILTKLLIFRSARLKSFSLNILKAKKGLYLELMLKLKEELMKRHTPR